MEKYDFWGRPFTYWSICIRFVWNTSCSLTFGTNHNFRDLLQIANSSHTHTQTKTHYTMASHILIWLSCTIKVDNVMQTPFKSDIIINANYGSLRQQILRSCVIRSSDSVTLLRHTSFECRWDTNSTLSYANWHFHIIEWIQSVFSLFIPTLHTIPSAFSHPNIIQCGWSSPPPPDKSNRLQKRKHLFLQNICTNISVLTQLELNKGCDNNHNPVYIWLCFRMQYFDFWIRDIGFNRRWNVVSSSDWNRSTLSTLRLHICWQYSLWYLSIFHSC